MTKSCMIESSILQVEDDDRNKPVLVCSSQGRLKNRCQVSIYVLCWQTPREDEHDAL
jgi:hypothetical protein